MPHHTGRYTFYNMYKQELCTRVGYMQRILYHFLIFLAIVKCQRYLLKLRYMFIKFTDRYVLVYITIRFFTP